MLFYNKIGGGGGVGVGVGVGVGGNNGMSICFMCEKVGKYKVYVQIIEKEEMMCEHHFNLFEEHVVNGSNGTTIIQDY